MDLKVGTLSVYHCHSATTPIDRVYFVSLFVIPQVPLRNITWRYLRDFRLAVNPNTTRQRIQETQDGGLELALFLEKRGTALSPSQPNLTITLAVNSTDQVFFANFVLMYRFRYVSMLTAQLTAQV